MEETPEQTSAITSEEPPTITRRKRNYKSILDENFVSSEIISDSVSIIPYFIKVSLLIFPSCHTGYQQ